MNEHGATIWNDTQVGATKFSMFAGVTSPYCKLLLLAIAARVGVLFFNASLSSGARVAIILVCLTI